MNPLNSNTSSSDPATQRAYWEHQQRQREQRVRPGSPPQVVQRPASPDPRRADDACGAMDLDEEASQNSQDRQESGDTRSSEKGGAGMKRPRTDASDGNGDGDGDSDSEHALKRVRLMPASEPVIVNPADHQPLTGQQRLAGYHALRQAIDADDAVKLQCLLQTGQADPNWAPADDFLPIDYAQNCSSDQSVLALLNAGAGTQDFLNELLWGYAETGNLSLVDALLRRGAKTGFVNLLVGTVLMVAVLSRNAALVERLLSEPAALASEEDNGSSLMIAAAQAGDVPMLEVLLRHGVKVDEGNDHDETALMAAAQHGQAAAFEFLRSKGASLHSISMSGDTLLICAAQGGSRQIVDAVLQTGCDVDSTNEDDETALMRVAAYGNAEIFDYLRTLGASSELTSGTGKTLLMFAAKGGNLQIVQTLLASGADIDSVDDNGRTPLMRAVKKGHVEVVRCLIDAKASLSPKNASLISIAFKAGHPHIVKMLLEAGCDPDTKDEFNETPLVHVVDKGDIEIFDCLVAAGASIGVRGKSGNTLLMIATEQGHVRLVEALLRLKADPNAVNGYGQTALLIASGWAPTEVIAALIKAGAALNVLSEFGDTPLMLAIRSANLDQIKLLIAAGCQVDTTSPYGVTPLSLAISKKQPAIVNTLIDAGANLTDKLALPIFGTDQKIYLPPLHVAIFAGDLAAVGILLDKGADIDAPDQHGLTPLMHAVIQGRRQLVGLLVSRGANVRLLMPAIAGLPTVTAQGFGRDTFLLEDGYAASVIAYDWTLDPDRSPCSAADLAIRDGQIAILDCLLAHGAWPQRAVAAEGPAHDLLMYWRSQWQPQAAVDDAAAIAAIADLAGTTWVSLLEAEPFDAAAIDYLRSVARVYTPLQTALRATFQSDSQSQRQGLLQALAGTGRALSVAQKLMIFSGALINLETLPIAWAHSGTPFAPFDVADPTKFNMTAAAGVQLGQLAELGRALQAPLTDGLSDLLSVCADFTKLLSESQQVQVDVDGLIQRLTAGLGLFGPLAERVAKAWLAVVEQQNALIIAHNVPDRERVVAQYQPYQDQAFDFGLETLDFYESVDQQAPTTWLNEPPSSLLRELVDQEEGANPLAQSLLVSLGRELKSSLDGLSAGLLRDPALQGEAADIYAQLIFQQLNLLRQFWEQAIAASAN